MATFADMATLLMAFFVLLLSFAEMNVPKYKEVSGSLKNAFGVQRLVPVVEPPKAKSIIAQQYKAARVDPTLMDVIQEQTTNLEQPIDPELKTDTKKADFATNSDVESVQNALAKEIAEGKVSVRVEDNKLIVDVASEATSGMSGTDSARNSGAKIAQNDLEVYAKIAAAQAQVASQITVEQASPDNVADSMSGESAEGKEQAIADQFKRIRMALSNEISQGLAEVERDGDKIIVRLAERGSFRSGYADLQPSFKPLLNKVGASISDAAGLITIEGHTDNVPIAFSERFRSNWDLSAARSAAVADYLLNNTDVADGRVTVTGFADTKPLASNDTPAGRSRNRRIEVIIDGG
jgi:chemotaxis protein MotB